MKKTNYSSNKEEDMSNVNLYSSKRSIDAQEKVRNNYYNSDKSEYELIIKSIIDMEREILSLNKQYQTLSNELSVK